MSCAVLAEGDAPALPRPRKYSDELRERAVRFYFESNRPIAHVAQNLELRGQKKRTRIPDGAAAERARDLLQRDFTATRPNEKWIAELTYIRTWSSFVYLAFVLDCNSRRIVG